MRLHFKEYGGGFPLIILHGLFGSLENWQTVSDRLSDSFHIFALDQRNHGRSPHGEEMDYSLMADDVREFMEERSFGSAHLLGHSMGGKTAMQSALNFPEKVKKLIVADMAPRQYPPEHEIIFNALLALDLKSLKTRPEIEMALEPTIPDWVVRRFLLKNLTRDEHGGYKWRINLQALHQNYPKLNQALSVERPFDKPTLFIRGANSDYIREEDVPELRRLFPQAQLRTIPDAGHWLHAEQPDEFVRTVREFLAE